MIEVDEKGIKTIDIDGNDTIKFSKPIQFLQLKCYSGEIKVNWRGEIDEEGGGYSLMTERTSDIIRENKPFSQIYVSGKGKLGVSII